jgi:hypothetical protein
MCSMAQARSMLDAISSFGWGLSAFFKAHNRKKFPDSPAEKERAAYVDPTVIDLAYDTASFLQDCATDNMVGFRKMMIDPIPVFAPWVCVRVAVETSAYCAWLVEPGIPLGSRANRGFAYRYKNLEEGLKFSRTTKLGKERVEKAESRLRLVIELAREQDIPVLEDKKGRLIGLGESFPAATTLMAQIFGDESSYRLLSAMTHGFPWASGLVVKLTAPDDGVSPRLPVAKHMSAYNVCYMSTRIVRAVAKAVWLRSQQLGWDLAHLGEILDTTYSDMEIKPNHRFWRTTEPSEGQSRTGNSELDEP